MEPEREPEPDSPEMRELVASLLALRDCLVNAGQALRDIHGQIDLEAQQRAREALEKLIAASRRQGD
ncbi:hypothetical protein ACHMW6_12785 [Pseudoduganella sp. UC29_106]|uniref:hypothetical protein n=1 Tax=Pseudoduganella sp. UC29_106 TaxID=3374553 RepID=UPI0037567F90